MCTEGLFQLSAKPLESMAQGLRLYKSEAERVSPREEKSSSRYTVINIISTLRVTFLNYSQCKQCLETVIFGTDGQQL